jgi:uncharacterized protein
MSEASVGPAVVARFRAALDGLVERLREDRAVLAAILGGSLAHDTVWSRSDIDLVLVTIDDKKAQGDGLSLDADGVNVHANLIARGELRRLVEGARQHSFMHSFLAKGRLLYTHDDTIVGLLERLRALGDADTAVQLLQAGTAVLGPLYKAHKWLRTRGDLHYTALWLLYTATPLAQVEVISRRVLVDREVIPQALALNPSFFRTVYTDLLDAPKSRAQVEGALAAVDAYLAERAPTLFAPVLAHLREVGEARSCTEIDDHFRRHLGVEGASAACEYLADHGLVGRASVAARLTKRSTVDVQELAFYALD